MGERRQLRDGTILTRERVGIRQPRAPRPRPGAEALEQLEAELGADDAGEPDSEPPHHR